MNTFSKVIFGAALAAGAMSVGAAPAAAQVSVGIGVGFPGYYGPGYYGPGYYGRGYYGSRYYASRYCDPYSRYYDPYYCDDYGYGYGYGYGPAFSNIIFFDGGWWRGPFRSRFYNGHRWYWVNNGWRRNEWRGQSYPRSMTFRNGGHYRNGRFEGFRGADRWQARGDLRSNWGSRANGGNRANWGDRGGDRSMGDRRFNSGSFRGGSVNTQAQFDRRSYQGRSDTGASVRAGRGGGDYRGGQGGGDYRGGQGGRHGH